MTGRAGQYLRTAGVVTVVALPLVLLALLLQPSLAPAQAPTSSAAPASITPALPPGYVGAETCRGCHAEAFEKFAQTKMGRLFLKQPRNAQEALACESCHGPGKAHADAGGGKGVGGMITFARKDKTPVEQRNAMCTSCHNRGPHLMWKGSAHEARNVPCTGCHRLMEDVSAKHQLAKATQLETCGTCHQRQRAMQMRTSHMPVREGKMTCTSCHDPHGTMTQTLLRENSVNDTCFRCHAEKRGPFLWEHAPVVESCANCHNPHGSNHEAMLKTIKPRLCQQCHIESRHPTNTYGRDGASVKFVMGKQCNNCHVNIHGSNHPSGHAFTR